MAARQPPCPQPNQDKVVLVRDDAVNVLADVLVDRNVLVDRGDVLVDGSSVGQDAVGPWRR